MLKNAILGSQLNHKMLKSEIFGELSHRMLKSEIFRELTKLENVEK